MSNPVRAKLRARELTVGSWIQAASVTVAEVLARSGFEWLVLDCEHGLIDIESLGAMLGAMERDGVVPFVRVPANDPTWIRRVLDAGAMGIVVPMVCSGAEAARAVKAARYPPAGARGFGFSRANGYGRTFDRYVRDANDAVAVVVQIEHIDAIRHLDAILSTRGIDGAIVGPYDLSGSMGIPGQLDHPAVVRAMDRVLAACRRHRKSAGLHVVSGAAARVARAVQQGYTFLALGMDVLFLQAGSDAVLAAARRAAAGGRRRR